MSKDLSKIFYNNLLEYHNLTKDDITNNYQYCGCTDTTEGSLCPKWRRFWMNKPIKLPQPELADKCICERTITYNHYLVDNNFENILIIGSCCQAHFTNISKNLHCERCEKKHIIRINNIYKDNICSACHKEEDKKIKAEKKQEKKKRNYYSYIEPDIKIIEPIIYNNCKCGKSKKSNYKQCYNCLMRDREITKTKIIDF